MASAPRGARRGAARQRTASASPKDEKNTPPADPDTAARQLCLRMLERKARSRSELEQALTKREIPPEVTRKVLDRFVEVGLIDDAALAESMAGAQHRERGLAQRAIAMKLRSRGLDDEIVESAVSGIDAEVERARALDLVTRRLRSLRNLPPDVQTRRLIGLLARKGYAGSMVYEVVREAMRIADETADEAADQAADEAADARAAAVVQVDDFYDVSI